MMQHLGYAEATGKGSKQRIGGQQTPDKPDRITKTWTATFRTIHSSPITTAEMRDALRRGLIVEGTLADEEWDLGDTVELFDRSVASGEDYPRPDEDGAL